MDDSRPSTKSLFGERRNGAHCDGAGKKAAPAEAKRFFRIGHG
ncbi:hypothetical protein [Asaia platycodi]|nr:hypothetical protein [Asaia platycodi]